MTKQTCKQSRDATNKLRPNPDNSCFGPLASAGELAIQLRPIASLTPHRRNARTHSRKQIRQIARSIETFGFTNPILIDAAGGILAGHGRVEAAKLLGMTEVPTIELAALNEEQRRAYAITDNRLGELAGWDRDLLRLELGELSVAFPELDLTLTGFETGELDIILLADASGMIASDPRADDLPHMDSIPVTRNGDLWLAGSHRLLCSDARDPDAYRILLQKQRVHLALTDPPFNVAIDGHARGLGQHHHRDFAMASGEMTETEYIAFLKIVFRNMADVSVPGAVHFTFMDWRHFHEVLSAGRNTYNALLNVCVWAKGNGGMGSLYRSEHEHVFVWRVGNNAHTNNVQLGSFGRNRTNVWRYPGANSFGPGRAEMLELHPTVTQPSQKRCLRKPICKLPQKSCSFSRFSQAETMTVNPSDLLEAYRTNFSLFAIKVFNILNPGQRFITTGGFLTMSHALAELQTGQIKRLLITVPPRSGKSMLASVALPAFVLGRDPTRRVLCASYSGELAAKFARDCRSVMMHPSYRKLFPATVIAGKNTEAEIETAHGGFRYATSVGGTLTGRGGNYIVVDDPIKPEDAMSRAARDRSWEWFTGTVGSRLDNKAEDSIIVVMQRLHVDDLAGHLLEQGGWYHLSLPAIAEIEEDLPAGLGRTFSRKIGDVLDPRREPLEILEQIKRDLSTSTFNAQYQQSPIPLDGTMLKWSWFKFYRDLPQRMSGDRVVQSWDTASKAEEINDYSVGTTWLIKKTRQRAW